MAYKLFDPSRPWRYDRVFLYTSESKLLAEIWYKPDPNRTLADVETFPSGDLTTNDDIVFIQPWNEYTDGTVDTTKTIVNWAAVYGAGSETL